MASKKVKTSWPSSSMAHYEQEEQFGLSPNQALFASQFTKKRKVSWRSNSIEEILDELEETASSPCQTPLAFQSTNDSFASRRKRGPTKCLKTHGLSHEDRLAVRLNVHGQPIGHNRSKLSNYFRDHS